MTFRALLVFTATWLSCASSWAAPILQVSGGGAAGAQAAEAGFLAGLPSYHRETFEGAAVGHQSHLLSTGVGTFASLTPGYGGACDHGSFGCANGLAVLNDTTTPFSGRAASPAGSDNHNWLDSMDAQALSFAADGVTTAIGFYLSDPNDAGGRMTIEIGGSLFDLFGGALRNGSLFYVTLFDPEGLHGFTLYANNANDGYGIDNFSVAVAVPEPGTLILLALGIAALALHRRLMSP